MALTGQELFHHPDLGFLERWYCRLFGVPIVGLRIRARVIQKLLPETASCILDAGCGRGVISRILARKYPLAELTGLDTDSATQAANGKIAERSGLKNCKFKVGDLTTLDESGKYDLIISIDNLEHIENDLDVLCRFASAMTENGILIVHVPHFYRRWPLFKWTTNFEVPGHVRPGYHLPEIVERARKAGFSVERSGFSYGFLENLANNIGYAITTAEEKNRLLYAALFPLLNFLAWLGRGANPGMGAGVWLICRKFATPTALSAIQDEEFPDVD